MISYFAGCCQSHQCWRSLLLFASLWFPVLPAATTVLISPYFCSDGYWNYEDRFRSYFDCILWKYFKRTFYISECISFQEKLYCLQTAKIVFLGGLGSLDRFWHCLIYHKFKNIFQLLKETYRNYGQTSSWDKIFFN